MNYRRGGHLHLGQWFLNSNDSVMYGVLWIDILCLWLVFHIPENQLALYMPVAPDFGSDRRP